MSLQNAVLGLLHYAPLSGYTIKKVFDMSINHIWTAKLSQIYRELAGLEKEGLVTSRMIRQPDRPDKKTYTLTPKGKKAFLDWLNEFPVSFGPPRRDEFLLRVFFASRMEKKLFRKELEEFIRMIEKYKRLIHKEKIYDFTEMLAGANMEANGKRSVPNAKKEAMFWGFAVKRFEMAGEAMLLWAKECLSQLEDK